MGFAGLTPLSGFTFAKSPSRSGLLLLAHLRNFNVRGAIGSTPGQK